MSTWDGNNFYFSGQGVVLIGDRDEVTGKPKGLRSVGNVTDLSINITTENLEHQESQTGQRSIDLRLTTQTNAELAATLENFNAENLKLALRGDTSQQDAASVADEEVLFYAGKVTPVDNVKLSNLVVDDGVTPLTLYVDDDNPWDYKANLEAGSILFNDGSEQLQDQLPDFGEAITALTVGTTTVITFASVPSYAEVGGKASPGNITWTVNPTNGQTGERAFDILAIDTGLNQVTLDWDTSGGTYGSAGDVLFDGFPFEANYDFETHQKVDALTQGSKERYLRFEGLNTADGLKPVVVEVFKFVVDPLAAFALISNEIQQFELSGNVLADSLRDTGSKFFKVSLLR